MTKSYSDRQMKANQRPGSATTRDAPKPQEAQKKAPAKQTGKGGKR